MGEKVKQDHFKYKHTLNKEKKSYLQTFDSWKKIEVLGSFMPV